MKFRVVAALIAGALSLWLNGGAQAQNVICFTPPVGDSSNLCASTQFVQQNISNPANLSAAFDAAFGSTRGSVVERGAAGWQILTPCATSGFPLVFNGIGADPGCQALTGAGVASNTVANSNLANMAALSVKCNLTGAGAIPTDCTKLPNPFSVGTSLFPILNGFEYDTNSAFGANTLGANNIVVGVPAATLTCCTWLNTYLPGVDSVGRAAVYAISTPNNTATGWTSVFAARSSDNTNVTPQTIIPNNNIVVHDNTSIAHLTWSGYDATYITATAIAATHLGREISIFNNGAACGAEDPFTLNPTRGCVALRTDCAVSGALGLNNCGPAFDIVNNGAKNSSGINVANNALDTSVTANPDALAMPNPYSISWYNAAGAKTWQMFAGIGANGNINLTTGGTGALAVTALSETTGQAYSTYTPTLSCNSGTLTTASATGRARQLGKTIFFQISISITTVGSCLNTLIASLPFTAGAFTYTAAGRETVLTGATVMGTISAGSATIVMTGFDNSMANTLTVANGSGNSTGHIAILANGTAFNISGTYERN
jgi:hypothetical protein